MYSLWYLLYCDKVVQISKSKKIEDIKKENQIKFKIEPSTNNSTNRQVNFKIIIGLRKGEKSILYHYCNFVKLNMDISVKSVAWFYFAA